MKNNLINLLYKLENRLLQHSTRNSIKELDNLLADEFIEFGSSGRIFNKKDIIERLPTENPISLEMLDFNITILSPDLVQTKFVINKESNTYSLRSSIWKLKKDNWQMVFHQGTPTKLKKL
ncbi:MAG: hypothetical protein K0S34_1734 [Bacillales bacterium]|jgi:hypothetical protein|nr:hypothetical protein [Bacillales bacterium]